MAGVLPASGEMTRDLQALDYTEGSWTGGAFTLAGLGVRGHEFHYSRVEPLSDARFAIRLERGKGISEGLDGMYEHSSVGSYTHSYFSPDFSRSFIQAAMNYRKI
jgi:cobyrinic acid a,c-diamide synthase